MDSAAQAEMFADLPTAEPRSTGDSPLERFRHFAKVQQTQGGLIPQNVLGSMLGLSKQRISQLVAEGRFTTFTLWGQTFITGASFEAFAVAERKSGRPLKSPTLRDFGKVLKHAPALGKMLDSKKKR